MSLSSEISKENSKDQSKENYIVFCDGASNPHHKRSGIGAVWFNINQFYDPGDPKTLKPNEKPVYFLSTEIFKNDGYPTNNEAEYEALIAALKLSISKNMINPSIYMDSKLVIFQVQNKWKINFSHLQELKNQVDELKSLISFTLRHVDREYNTFADIESKRCIGQDPDTKKGQKNIKLKQKRFQKRLAEHEKTPNNALNIAVNRNILDFMTKDSKF